MILAIYLLLENSHVVGACGANKDEKEILTTHFEGFFVFREVEDGCKKRGTGRKKYNLSSLFFCVA